MIKRKQDEWLADPSCTVSDLVAYIEKANEMRDAQIEAIKTYLFLKIACGNKPLTELIAAGTFNSLDVDELSVSQNARRYLQEHPAALALYEYASLTNDAGEQVSKATAAAIAKDANAIDYEAVIDEMFYKVTYTDYLFSLPMGAGKTYLMAAFIYLDLYFAMNEPDNPAFAHNFIVFAPSGLKSSVVPSLRTIQNFDPSWIIPEPAASDVKRLMKFEVLDAVKTAKKSNKTKNPNVQKINMHQPFSELIGLVAVTNAEKVILSGVSTEQLILTDDVAESQSNELRYLIGKIPNLSIFIDEVHHAVTDEIKLRNVVNKWAGNGTVNMVVGFSGTPYLEAREKVAIKEGLQLLNSEISNIVYYYPLIKGIGNFLKKPVVKISDDLNSLGIVETGVRAFFDKYADKTYGSGLNSKLGIYCGTIPKLEEHIYPLVCQIAAEHGLNPNDTVLRFHKGNKEYPQPVDSQLRFDTLDKSISKVRVILLVQIGKEGWDCRSLTGIILSQKGDCPTNMVLQTSCRCLRQVDKGVTEDALIYLNKRNGETLNQQLRQQHHISVKEFETGAGGETVTLNRYDRREHLGLPAMEFHQLWLKHQAESVAETIDVNVAIEAAADDCTKRQSVIVRTQTAFTGEKAITDLIDTPEYEGVTRLADFDRWLYEIVKGGFGFVSLPDLYEKEDSLRKLFADITKQEKGACYYKPDYLISRINENVRKAFSKKRTLITTEELIPNEARLLMVKEGFDKIETRKDATGAYYPEAELVERIIKDDRGELEIDPAKQAAIDALIVAGMADKAEEIRSEYTSHPQKDRSFHYLPYKTDSGFEKFFLSEALQLTIIAEKDLEIYFNGDRHLTDFHIRCYKKNGKRRYYIGQYTPDFLILQRKDETIHKVLITETKGHIYANDPKFKDRRKFVEDIFIPSNNEKHGYKRFEYLYLEDTLSETQRIQATAAAINKFFVEA
jgi:superfamily II DNA or RNA helicase